MLQHGGEACKLIHSRSPPKLKCGVIKTLQSSNPTNPKSNNLAMDSEPGSERQNIKSVFLEQSGIFHKLSIVNSS